MRLYYFFGVGRGSKFAMVVAGLGSELMRLNWPNGEGMRLNWPNGRGCAFLLLIP
jgi:hypothetical protein